MIGIITYISVLERTKEIGVLRSIGASKKDVGRVFNAETVIIGGVSGLFGVIFSALLTIPIRLILKNITGVLIPVALPFTGAVVLVLVSVCLTLISGLIPSRVASKKDPVVALRSE
ncbi:MAG: FtsX-like permease family protein, partial [Clostridia bacterium]|nr:FtsX-like permease family protein [Clostridia bacterium]